MRPCGTPRLVIAAPHGRSGKTITTIGLLAALKKAGYSVQPYKKGPDFIDPSWMTRITGRLCRNLDSFLMDRETIRASFARSASDADIAVVEGAMGLFDGVDLEGSGSTAEIAKAIAAPVILVVDTTRMTRSVAAMVTGYQHFDPEVRVAGVILNKVARARHEQMLRAAVERYCGIPVLGVIPKGQKMDIPDRHLGLVPAEENDEMALAIDEAGHTTGDCLDLPAIIEVARSAGPLAVEHPQPGFPDRERGHTSVSGKGTHLRQRKGDTPPAEECPRWNVPDGMSPMEYPQSNVPNLSMPPILMREPGLEDLVPDEPRIRVAVFLDQAFTFYYPENLEALASAGAEIVRVNTLADTCLPDVDAAYIGGGFPEVLAAKLVDNQLLRNNLRSRIEDGLPVYAECGGLMYLGRRISWRDREYPMVGALPFDVVMMDKPQGHGYITLQVENESPYFSVGEEVKGHEFHQSRVVNLDLDKTKYAFRITRGNGLDGQHDGIIYKNVLACYTHLHALATPEWAQRLVAAGIKHKLHRQ